MKDYLTRTQGFDFENNELFILSGGQQCADLTASSGKRRRCHFDRGRPLSAAEHIPFVWRQAAIQHSDQQDGMDADALEGSLSRAHPEGKLLYTIPSFQNPASGITATLSVRCAELACKYDIAILGDNPYGELRFSGEDVPTIKSTDTEAHCCTQATSR